jgi:3-hydroxyisobutyrate dehydrogenase-like beta-hydroxyacid dehydrogenase
MRVGFIGLGGQDGPMSRRVRPFAFRHESTTVTVTVRHSAVMAGNSSARSVQ